MCGIKYGINEDRILVLISENPRITQSELSIKLDIGKRTVEKIFKELKTPFIIHQAKYSMLNRWIEDGLDSCLIKNGIGIIAFSPLSQGILSDKYLNNIIPENSRAFKSEKIQNMLTKEVVEKLQKLNEIANLRGQTLSQTALSWVLNNKAVTSVLIGIRGTEQLEENVKCLENLKFEKEELEAINRILA